MQWGFRLIKTTKKGIWKTFLILYIGCILSMRREEHIFLNTIPEHVWFPIFNIISIGLLIVFYNRLFKGARSKRSKQKEGIIVFLIIFISMLSFSFNYVFNQSEYYRFKINKSSNPMIVGIKYNSPTFRDNQIIFYEKTEFVSYKLIREASLDNASSVSRNLKSGDYQVDLINSDTPKMVFGNGDFYYIRY